ALERARLRVAADAAAARAGRPLGARGDLRQREALRPGRCRRGAPTRAGVRRTPRGAAGGGLYPLGLRDLRLGDRAVEFHLDGERFLLDPVLVAQQLALRRRERDPDPVGQLEALLLAHGVDLVDQVENESFELELRVEDRV